MSANLPRAKSDAPSLVTGPSWNALVDEVRRLGRAQLPPGVSRRGDLGAVPSGTEIYARITGGGAGGKYAWAEVTRQGGNWVDTGRTGSTSLDPAIEANARTTVPVGRRVRLFRSRGEWVFAVPVCGPPPPVPCTGTTTIRFNVFGCGNFGLAGATVTLTKGDWSESKLTTGGGSFAPASATFDVTSQGSGTYTYEVSHPRFTNYTGSITIACNTATTAPTVQMAVLNVHPDYICTSLCPIPIRKTLYATNTFGTFALVWDGNPNESFNWWGCQLANVDSREIGLCGASAFCRGQGANAGTPVLYKFDGSSVTAYWYCTRLCADDGKVYRANIDCWTGNPLCFDGSRPSAQSNLVTSSADCAGWSFTGNFDALPDGDCSIPGVPGSGGSSGTILASPLVITE